MANTVTAVVLGGQPSIQNGVSTVGELAQRLNLPQNHSVKINDQSGDYSSPVNDFDFVAFGSKVEGGRQ